MTRRILLAAAVLAASAATTPALAAWPWCVVVDDEPVVCSYQVTGQAWDTACAALPEPCPR